MKTPSHRSDRGADDGGPGAPLFAADPNDPSDYPTTARVDYVIGCMATNGQTHEAMERCSCSIDHIARNIPYNSFVQLETVRRMQDMPGERAMLFRGRRLDQGLAGPLPSGAGGSRSGVLSGQ